MFECGTFAGIEDPEYNCERQFDNEGFQEPVCLVCGGLLNDYGECEYCSSLENEEIW